MRTPASLPLIALSAACTSSGDFNVFSIEDDIELGQQLRDEIQSDPETYPPLDESDYPAAYEHLYGIRDELLATGEIEHADDFEWEVYIIDDDETLNAFAAPGGYVWVYTGLMHFLEYQDELAGVMGHEFAHADLRHSTEQLTKAYGLATVMEIVLGEDPGLIAEIAAGLTSLSFSRTDEAEADEYSVRYLCETDYAADGAAGFFEKIEEAEGLSVPEFISSHPSSETRVADIQAMAAALGCSVELNDNVDYNDILDSLP